MNKLIKNQNDLQQILEQAFKSEKMFALIVGNTQLVKELSQISENIKYKNFDKLVLYFKEAFWRDEDKALKCLNFLTKNNFIFDDISFERKEKICAEDPYLALDIFTKFSEAMIINGIAKELKIGKRNTFLKRSLEKNNLSTNTLCILYKLIVQEHLGGLIAKNNAFDYIEYIDLLIKNGHDINQPFVYGISEDGIFKETAGTLINCYLRMLATKHQILSNSKNEENLLKTFRYLIESGADLALDLNGSYNSLEFLKKRYGSFVSKLELIVLDKKLKTLDFEDQAFVGERKRITSL